MKNRIHHGILIFFLGIVYSCQMESTKINISPPHIGIQIQEARDRVGISQEQLAETLGLTLNNIKTIEEGKAVPTRDIIVEIEERLGCEIVLDNT